VKCENSGSAQIDQLIISWDYYWPLAIQGADLIVSGGSKRKAIFCASAGCGIYDVRMKLAFTSGFSPLAEEGCSASFSYRKFVNPMLTAP
jgi:hypothetical protein